MCYTINVFGGTPAAPADPGDRLEFVTPAGQTATLTITGPDSGTIDVTGGYEQAIDYYEQAIDLCDKTGDLTHLGKAFNYLASTYYQMGNLVKARDAFEKALPVLEKSGDQASMMEILINIAKVLGLKHFFEFTFNRRQYGGYKIPS